MKQSGDRGHVEDLKNVYRNFPEKFMKVKCPKDLAVDGTAILKLISARVGRCGLDTCGLEQGPVQESCEGSIYTSGSIKSGVTLNG